MRTRRWRIDPAGKALRPQALKLAALARSAGSTMSVPTRSLRSMRRGCRGDRRIHAASTGCSGAPGGIRTPDLLIRSQLLYPLSYGRVAANRNRRRPGRQRRQLLGDAYSSAPSSPASVPSTAALPASILTSWTVPAASRTSIDQATKPFYEVEFGLHELAVDGCQCGRLGVGLTDGIRHQLVLLVDSEAAERHQVSKRVRMSPDIRLLTRRDEIVRRTAFSRGPPAEASGPLGCVPEPCSPVTWSVRPSHRCPGRVRMAPQSSALGRRRGTPAPAHRTRC